MLTHKATGRIVGVLFILASATAIIGGSLLLPLTEPDYLSEVAANAGQIVSGVLLELVLVVSVVGIAVLLYPVLKRVDEGLAMGYVGARTLEAVLLMVAAVTGLVVLSLGEGLGTASGVELVGDSFLFVRDWTYLIGSMVMLGVSALILNSLLYRSRLVPGWLSLWGLIGGALILVRGLIETFGTEFSGVVQGVFAAPIALQEMVLAVWLIIKGFEVTQPAPVPRSTPQKEAAAIR